MIGFKGMSVDLLVTPDHRVLASELTTREGRSSTFRLRPAHAVLWKAHRHTLSASWVGGAVDHVTCDGTKFPLRPLLRLVGLFIGDRNLSPRTNCIAFNIRKDREIDFLARAASDSGLELRRWTHAFRSRSGLSFERLFASCYDRDCEKVIPHPLLGLAPDLLGELYQGLLASDGTRSGGGVGATGDVLHDEPLLADQVQELALKLGRSASVRPFGCGPATAITGPSRVSASRSTTSGTSIPAYVAPGAGREQEMGVEGTTASSTASRFPVTRSTSGATGIPCGAATRPSSTTRSASTSAARSSSRANGSDTGSSFNEFSLRYAKATEDFYVPEAEDVRTQVGKPGAYSFEPVDAEVAERPARSSRRLRASLHDVRAARRGRRRPRARALRAPGRRLHRVLLDAQRPLADELRLAAGVRVGPAGDPALRGSLRDFLAERMPVTHEAFVAADRRALGRRLDAFERSSGPVSRRPARDPDHPAGVQAEAVWRVESHLGRAREHGNVPQEAAGFPFRVR